MQDLVAMLNMFGSSTPILLVVFIETIGVFWFYGVNRLFIVGMFYHHYITQVLRRRGADDWSPARPILAGVLAVRLPHLPARHPPVHCLGLLHRWARALLEWTHCSTGAKVVIIHNPY